MTRLFVLCEGLSEKRFVEQVLVPYLWQHNQLNVSASLLGKGTGGNVNHQTLFRDVPTRLRADKNAYCTTLFDFYALRNDFVGKQASIRQASFEKKHEQLCEAMKSYCVATYPDIAARFIPYVQMYEFEALLFSDPVSFGHALNKPDLIPSLIAIRNKFATPEEINDSEYTAPSKRIQQLVPKYNKVIFGTLITEAIGLATIRLECKLFNAWLTHLESLT